jgi:peroxiredoxin Q/BCP
MEHLDRGSTAPGFSLFDQNGTNVVLSDELGKWIVLFFAPEAHEPAAVAMATAFRNITPDLDRLNTRIFGIYADETDKLRELADTHTIPFPLLSDTSKNIPIQYGAYAAHGILGHHTHFKPHTYILTPEGKIAAKYATMDMLHHPAQVIADLEELQKLRAEGR